MRRVYTDVRFQQFANYPWIKKSLGHVIISTRRGAGRLLYMIASANARPGTVRRARIESQARDNFNLYGRRPPSVYDSIGQCPAGHGTGKIDRVQHGARQIFTQVKQNVHVQWCMSISFLPSCLQRNRFSKKKEPAIRGSGFIQIVSFYDLETHLRLLQLL